MDNTYHIYTEPSNQINSKSICFNQKAFFPYKQGSFKRKNKNMKSKLSYSFNPNASPTEPDTFFKSTYQADYSRFYYPKENTKVFSPTSSKQEFSRCFRNTYVLKKNTFFPRFGCQNNMVNRLYNKTLENLYLRPKKTYSQVLPFIQCRRNQSLSKSVVKPSLYETIPEEYKDKKRGKSYDLYSTNKTSQNEIYDDYKNTNTIPVERYNYNSEELKPKKESTSVPKEKGEVNTNVSSNYLGTFIPKKTDFNKPQIFNNYKPFLHDSFIKYGEY